jgi:hypothetical protein
LGLPDGAGRLHGVCLRITNGHLRLCQGLADGFVIVAGGDAQEARALGLAVDDAEGGGEIVEIASFRPKPARPRAWC